MYIKDTLNYSHHHEITDRFIEMMLNEEKERERERHQRNFRFGEF